jgi:hypothetical protein
MSLSAGQLMEYAEKQALAAVFRQAQSPATGSVYQALLTAAPGSGADLTMAAETEYAPTSGYARQVYGPGAPSSASPSVISNSGAITWGPFTGTVTGTVTWTMCCDASSGTTANNIAAYLLTSSRTPAAGDSLSAAISAFTCQL